jgi:FAD/FMN-containing dehydrogenase
MMSVGIAPELAAIVGDEHVLTDEASRVSFSQDLSLEAFTLAEAVVAPGTAEEVVEVVRQVRASGRALAVRAGGMSYTRSHVPAREGIVLIDIRRLDRIVELNARDGYVTVEAGCTWEKLYLALRAEHVRTPFWGPLSGRVATVGGALSQNALFLGFARHGVASQSVLGLDVVLGDGARVRTGSGAHVDGSPFWRDFGPDLTGLFLGDSGAFGVKLEATLRLVPTPAVSAGASFVCDDGESLLAALESTTGCAIASDVYGFDRPLNALLCDAGFSYLRGAEYSVHVLVEAPDERIAEVCLDILRRAASPHAREVGAMRAMFRTARPAAHLPTNAIVPWSKAADALRIRAEFFAEQAATFAEHGIETWTLYAANPGGLNVEPALVLDDDLGPRSRAPHARQVALRARYELARRFDGLGAMHVQFGRYYDFLPNLQSPTRDLLLRLKSIADPDGIVAPGVLGLGEA